MIFKWRQTEPELILCAVRWYLRYSLSFRDVEELLSERGLKADHTTIWRWVQRYGPELEERLRRHLKPTNKSWRVDETYVRVQGRWCYLYRAIDSTGATIDFVLSGLRDAASAKRLFRKVLTDPSHPQPRVINTDQARLYGAAISGVKKEGILRRSRLRALPVSVAYSARSTRSRWLEGFSPTLLPALPCAVSPPYFAGSIPLSRGPAKSPARTPKLQDCRQMASSPAK